MKASQITKEAKLAEWANQIRECKNSGMPVTKWCKHKGIATSTYFYHYKKVMDAAGNMIEEARNANEVTTVSFVPIPERIQEETVSNETPDSNDFICFRFGDKTLELPQTVPKEYFRMALEVFANAQ